MINGRLITGWLIILLAAGPVTADPYNVYAVPLQLAQRGHSDNGGISLDQAVSRARQQTNGKVLSAETVRVDGRKVHRIKILTKKGRVKRLQYDVRTGQKISRGH
jgi:uncharacterized membrane protein YkoI